MLVADANYPQDTRFGVWADLQVFGGPAEVQGVPINGGSPSTIQVHVPATMTPGVKTFAVWASNVYAANAHGVDTTASIEIIAP